MVTVFIVDDEPKICKLIQKLIDWDLLELELIGFANNGIDAYKRISEDHPNIIITDIRMPGYDGVELIGMVKKLNYKCTFIIISGHRDFDYAHSALKYGVDNYLLKPIRKKELNDALRLICQKFSDDAVDNEEKLRNLAFKQQKFINDIFSNNIITSGEDIKTLFGKYEESAFYQALILKIDQGYSVPAENEDSDVRFKQFELFSSFISKDYTCLFILQMDFGMLAVLTYKDASGIPNQESFKPLLTYMKDKISPYNAYLATLGIGEISDSLSELRKTLLSARQCIRYRIITGADRLISYTGLPHEPTNHVYKYNSFQLIYAVEIIDCQTIEDLISDEKNIMKRLPVQNPETYFDFVQNFFETFIFSIKKYHSASIDEFALNQQFEKLMNDSFTIDSLFDGLKRLLVSSLKQCEQDNSLRQKRPILLAQQYIISHYSKKISLEEIAAVVNFNPAYFSNMFKVETGISLSDYITQYRIGVAKTLLKNSQESIGEIAVSAGFGDQKYFSKIFHRLVGLSPSKYRSLYS